MRKMRLHNLVTALVLVCTAGFWSCSNDDVDSQGPFITPNPTTLAFDASGDTLAKSISIESNRDWTASFLESGVDSWISIDTKSGNGNGTIKVTVLPNDKAERTATLKLVASTVSVNVKITQYAEGGSPIGEILYKENCGTSVEKVNDKWPFVDQYTGWERGGTLDQKTVTYTGNSSNVSNSGAAFAPGEGSPFSGAPYVGMNTAASQFIIGDINITGNANLTLKFGTIFQSNYVSSAEFGDVTSNSFGLSASVDGTNWAALTYSVTKPGAGNWYQITSEFKVPTGSTKLYVKYVTSNLVANQGYRFDDFTLYTGGNGQLIDPNGGGKKTFITVAQLRAKGEGNITDTVYVKASVISNKEGGNSTSLKNVVLSDGEAGIAVRFTANADYAVGTELELALLGAQLAKYQGLLQLNNFNNLNAATTGQTKIIPAKTISAEDLFDAAYESMYVAIPDVEVVSADLGKTMVVDAKHTNIGMESKTGEEFSMFSASYSVFKDSSVPQGSGTLKGIAGINIGDGGIAVYQVAPQTAKDFAGLTGPRFGAAAQLTFGTPKYVGPDFKVGESFMGKVVIPYQNATGLENYSVSIYATGDAAIGFDTAMVSKTLMEGNNDLEISVSGKPEVAGSFTYVIAGVKGLTTSTIAGSVVGEAAPNGADLNTLTASSSYKDVETTAGWIGKNVAVQQGGDKDANPIFKFIGSAENRAVCLNGKTSTVGSLTSPTLTGGCGTLSFKYGNAFSEANGVSVKIEIKQNGVIVKTFNLIKTKDEVTSLTAYSYSVDVNVTDNFEIIITNNSPSAVADANKDRLSIFDITWTSKAN